jgi:hypothetical protein
MTIEPVEGLTGRVTWIGESGQRLWVVFARGRGPLQGPHGQRYLTEIRTNAATLSAWRIKLSCDASAAVAGDTLFLADGCDSLRRFSLHTRIETAAVKRVRPTAASIGYAGYLMIAANGITRVRPRAIAVRTVSSLEGVTAFAAGGRSLWALAPTHGTVIRLDPRTGKTTARVSLRTGP